MRHAIPLLALAAFLLDAHAVGAKSATTLQAVTLAGDAGGPRVAGVTVLDDTPIPGQTTIRIDFSGAIFWPSMGGGIGEVTAGCFAAFLGGPILYAAGWGAAAYVSEYDVAGNALVFYSDVALKGGYLAVTCRGTGAAPVLGTNGVPLAGGIDDPPTMKGADWSTVMAR